MHDRESAAVLAVLLCPGAGTVSARRAIETAQRLGLTLYQLVSLPRPDLRRRLCGTQPDLTGIANAMGKDRFSRAASLISEVARAGGHVVRLGGPGYPRKLEQHLGRYAPPLIFMTGNTQLMEGPAAAVVGARRPSDKGADIARFCAQTFAERRVPVVSGGAQGVDRLAHEAALKRGGKTVVVLPEGILRFAQPACLGGALGEGRALIVSQFVPDMRWQTHAAVTRNATISALAQMLCVIEPKKQGGSIRAAKSAIGQGKTVLYYDPGQTSPLSAYTEQGAHDMSDNERCFDKDRLMRFWRSCGGRARGQSAFV